MPSSPRGAPPPRSTAAPSVTPPVLLPQNPSCPALLARTRRAPPPRSAAGSAHPPTCSLSHREPGPAATSAAALVPNEAPACRAVLLPHPTEARLPTPGAAPVPSPLLQPATRTGFPHPPTLPIRRPASHRAQRHSIRRAVPTGARNANRFSHLRRHGTQGRTRSWTAAGKNYVRGPNGLSRRTGLLSKRRRSPSGAPDRWAPQPERVLGKQLVHGLLKRDEHLME